VTFARFRRPAAAPAERTASRPSLGAFLRYFLGLGTWGFGGPIATVGYMQRDLVEKRGWLNRKDFLDGVALGQTMPGPLAAKVCMWVGYLQRGALGAAAVAVPFILPSFLLVLGVAVVYVRYQGLPIVQSLFYGIAPGVMAIIVIAAVKLARLTNRRDRRLWAVSAVILVVTALTGAEVALLFLAAAFLMVAIEAPPRWLRSLHLPAVFPVLGSGAVATAASAGTLQDLALFFLKAGAFIFGSGLAIVPFLRQGVVIERHWLTQRQFLDAVAMGLISPGPVVITATFIGYLVAGFPGAVVATAAIFLPVCLPRRCGARQLVRAPPRQRAGPGLRPRSHRGRGGRNRRRNGGADSSGGRRRHHGRHCCCVPRGPLAVQDPRAIHRPGDRSRGTPAAPLTDASGRPGRSALCRTGIVGGPRCSGSRCKTGAVLATVTGERTPTTTGSRPGKVERASIREPGDRPW
jgi:chromate transporter